MLHIACSYITDVNGINQTELFEKAETFGIAIKKGKEKKR